MLTLLKLIFDHGRYHKLRTTLARSIPVVCRLFVSITPNSRGVVFSDFGCVLLKTGVLAVEFTLLHSSFSHSSSNDLISFKRNLIFTNKAIYYTYEYMCIYIYLIVVKHLTCFN